MIDFLQEYFTIISGYNRAIGVAKTLKRLPTQVALEKLSATVPSSSRLYCEVNRYLAKNFSQPRASTQ